MRKIFCCLLIVAASCSSKEKEAFIKRYAPNPVQMVDIEGFYSEVALFCSLDDIKFDWTTSPARKALRSIAEQNLSPLFDAARCKRDWQAAFNAEYPKIGSLNASSNGSPMYVLAARPDEYETVYLIRIQNMIVTADSPGFEFYVYDYDYKRGGPQKFGVRDVRFGVNRVCNEARACNCFLQGEKRRRGAYTLDGKPVETSEPSRWEQFYSHHPLSSAMFKNPINAAAKEKCNSGSSAQGLAEECKKERGAISTKCMNATYSVDDEMIDILKENQYCGAVRSRAEYSQTKCVRLCKLQERRTQKSCLDDCTKCFER